MMTSLVIWISFYIFSRVAADSCSDSADLCMTNITTPDYDITYQDIGVGLYSPDKWAAVCQEYKEQDVVGCLQEVLTSASCSLSEVSQAGVRDSIAEIEFKCSEDALQVYADNWDCFRDQRFVQAWSNCHQDLIDASNRVYTEIILASDPQTIAQLMQDLCVSYEKYLLCTYSTAKVFCGPEMGEYMYDHEHKPIGNKLVYLDCSPPADISDLTLCDPDSARLCITSTKSHIHTLTTSHMVQRMCQEINTVNSTFTTCYHDNTHGCQSDIKAELDILTFPVTLAIEEVSDLCDQPVLPTESDCEYSTLKQCETTLLSALDLEVKQLCSLRGSFYQNLSSCLDEHLVNCPSVTQQQYRDRQKEIQQLWWSGQSNHTCDLENECVDDFINRIGEMTQCFRSNATHESFETICNDYQQSLLCLERLINGCQPVVDALYKEKALDDLFESATFHDCNVTFNGVHIAATKHGCNYRHILQCYSSFFSLVGIQRTNYLPYLHNVSNMFIHTVQKHSKEFCSTINSADLRQCLDSTLPQCVNFTKEKLDHKVSSTTYQDVTYDSNKILSYDFVMDIEYLCSTGCSNISHQLSAVNHCSLKKVSFLEITDNVVLHNLTGTYYNNALMEQNCGHLRAYTRCVMDQAGSCPLIRHHYLDIHKFVHPDLTRTQLLQHCNITMDSACDSSLSHCLGRFLSSMIRRGAMAKWVQTILQQRVITNHTQTCSTLSSLDLPVIQGCLSQMAAGCVYGRVYISDYMDSLTMVQRVKTNMCTTECYNVSSRAVVIQNYCGKAEIRLLQANTTGQSVLSGGPSPGHCRELQELSDCMSYQAGQCPYLQQLVGTILFGNIMINEVMSLCDTQYSRYTGYVTVSATGHQTTHSGHQTTQSGHQAGKTSSSVVHRGGYLITSVVVVAVHLMTFSTVW